MEKRFQMTRLADTEAGARACCKILDDQIDELQEQLDSLQSLRGEIARRFGIDRRADASRIGVLLDSAQRSHYEGAGAAHKVSGSTVPLTARGDTAASAARKPESQNQ